MVILIGEITDSGEVETSVEVIRQSFGTVAHQFGLTKENCPTHPSFVTLEQLKTLHAKGQRFFGLFQDGVQVGFVAAEKITEGEYALEKLAVLPSARHNGYGARLVRFVTDLAARQGARRLSLGMIDRHTVLKDWYKGLGFLETRTQEFSHLPFTVCFMEIELTGDNAVNQSGGGVR